MAQGQSAREPDTFHSNFGLIERIVGAREPSSEEVAWQANQPPSFRSEATTGENRPDGRRWGRSAEKKEALPKTDEVPLDIENELSEEDIKKMLFGDNAIEEDPQSVVQQSGTHARQAQ